MTISEVSAHPLVFVVLRNWEMVNAQYQDQF